MGLSLKELKEQLIAKQGYTITPNHSQLNDLKILVDDMMGVRNESPPSSGSGYYSGTNCVGHIVTSDYNLSLGDIDSIDIKSCSCHTVNDTTAYCRSRTYSCSCNSNTPACTCNTRTYSCSCNSNTPVCDCNSRTPSSCDCQNRINWADLCPDYHLCTCVGQGDKCSCNTRTPDPCNCQNRTSSCGSRTQTDVTCGSRTADCGSRSTTSCTCNGRCACNSEKRFS